MKNAKHIIAIFIVLGVIATAAYLLPQSGIESILTGESAPAEVNADSTEAANDSAAVQDTTPFVDRMKASLEVIKAEYSRRKKRDVWTLGNGTTIIRYLLQAQRFINKNGGKVLYMEELFNDNTVFQSANLDALSPEGDTLRLCLQVSLNVFRDNASYLSVSFQVKELTPEMIVALNSLDFPYDLMIPPFGVPDGFYPDLDKVKDKEIVLWLLMESSSLDSRHKKMRPIRSYLTEDQIAEIISDAKTLAPSAAGIASRYAEKAVEHKPLLQAVLNAAKQNNLWFADLSQNNKSKVPEICPELNIDCKTLKPYDPSNSSMDDYIQKKIRSAARNGIDAIILPLSVESVRKVKSMKEKTTAQGTTLINLSTFMNTNKE
jgi:hypothetical protein